MPDHTTLLCAIAMVLGALLAAVHVCLFLDALRLFICPQKEHPFTALAPRSIAPRRIERSE